MVLSQLLPVRLTEVEAYTGQGADPERQGEVGAVGDPAPPGPGRAGHQLVGDRLPEEDQQAEQPGEDHAQGAGARRPHGQADQDRATVEGGVAQPEGPALGLGQAPADELAGHPQQQHRRRQGAALGRGGRADAADLGQAGRRRIRTIEVKRITGTPLG